MIIAINSFVYYPRYVAQQEIPEGYNSQDLRL